MRLVPVMSFFLSKFEDVLDLESNTSFRTTFTLKPCRYYF